MNQANNAKIAACVLRQRFLIKAKCSLVINHHFDTSINRG